MIPIEVFLIVVLFVYFLGRRHGKKALRNQYRDLFK